MWMTQAAMCHHFRDQMYLQNTWKITKMITLFSIIIHYSHICFHYYIYMSLPSFPCMFLIPWHLRIFQHIHHHQHGDSRILADGTRIWQCKCRYCITPVLGRRPQPSYPRHSFWTCLQPFLLDFNQPHPMSIIWWSFIWTFHSRIEFSFHPAVVFSRWRLWEWFQWELTDTLTYSDMYTPYVQYGTCILWPCAHYTMPSSGYYLLRHTTFPTQTSAPLPILQ